MVGWVKSKGEEGVEGNMKRGVERRSNFRGKGRGNFEQLFSLDHFVSKKEIIQL